MKITINGYILLHHARWMDKPAFEFWHLDMSDNDDYAMVQPHQITVDIPDEFDARPVLVKGLRKRQKKVRAEAEREIAKIEEKIQQLLSIEYKPEVSA